MHANPAQNPPHDRMVLVPPPPLSRCPGGCFQDCPPPITVGRGATSAGTSSNSASSRSRSRIVPERLNPLAVELVEQICEAFGRVSQAFNDSEVPSGDLDSPMVQARTAVDQDVA